MPSPGAALTPRAHAAGFARATLAAVVLVLTIVLTGGTAHAHATVVSSSPSEGQQLAAAPAAVSIQFSEAVSSDLGGLKVLDASGQRVDQDDSSQPTPASLRTSLRDGLGDGTYVANYKVVSADGHPVSGAIVFTVGRGSAADVSGLTAKNDPLYDGLSKAGQFLVYTGALAAAGCAFFLAFVFNGGPEEERLASIVRWTTIVAGLGVALTLVAQAAQATGNGPEAVLDRNVVGPVLRQGLGWSYAVLLAGLAAVHLAAGIAHRTSRQGLAFYGGLAVTSSFVLWGHALEAPRAWLAIPADVVHVAVAAVWFGGLLGLGVVLRNRAVAHRPTDPDTDTDTDTDTGREPGSDPGPVPGAADPADGADLPATVLLVRRFSTLAAVSVLLVVMAGLALSLAELGSLGALTSTSYGITLLAKIGAVVVILFIAGYNRFFLLPWLFGEDEPVDAHDEADESDAVGDGEPGETETEIETEPGETETATGARRDVTPTFASLDADEAGGWRTLLRTVRVEALVIVVVLALTAVLVNTTPPVNTVTKGGPFQESKPFRDGSALLTITPNKAGLNSFHLEFVGADGKPADLAQKVTLELRLPAQDLGPITREMVKAGTGHFLLEDVSDLSIPGQWQVTLRARVSDFDEQRVDYEDTVT